MKKISIFLSVLSLLIFSYLFLFFIGRNEARLLTEEDGVIESLAPIFYFFGAGILSCIYFKSKSQNRHYLFKLKRNIFFLLLAIFLVVCAGEEISWGQRMFGIESPDFFKKENAQKEINIHNLYTFEPYNENGIEKTGPNFYTSDRLFALVWILYCILIPLINTNFSIVRNVINKIHLPVIPIWIGILFLMNHIISKAFERLDVFFNFGIGSPLISPIVETKESIFAILYFIASISLYYFSENDQTIKK